MIFKEFGDIVELISYEQTFQSMDSLMDKIKTIIKSQYTFVH